MLDLSAIKGPEDFFTAVLPALVNRGLEKAGTTQTIDDKTQFNVIGEGSWHSQVVDGRMVVRDEPADDPLLQITTTADDWDALFTGPYAQLLVPTDPSKADEGLMAMNKIILDEQKRARMRMLSGDLQIVLQTADGDYRITFTLGGKPYDHDEPTCKITVKLEDWMAIMKKQLNPQEAFFQGKIRMEGDMNLAMGFTALMM